MNRTLAKIPVIVLSAGIFINSHLSSINVPDFSIAIQDKILHFSAFTILTATAYLAAKTLVGKEDLNHLRISFWYGLLFGLTDEIHQAFILGRTAEVMDWVADGIGAGFAILVIRIYLTRRANSLFEEQ